MKAGLVKHYSRFELQVACNASITKGDASGAYATGVVRTLWTKTQTKILTNQWGVNYGIYLSITNQKGSPNTTFARLLIEDLGFDETYSVAYADNSTALVEIDDLKVYNLPRQWKVKWGALRLYVNGVLQVTITARTFTGTLNYKVPSSIPLFGIPALLEGVGGVTTAPLTPPALVARATTDIDFTVTGGYRFKEAGSSTYVTLPVSLLQLSIPDGCDETTPGPEPTLTASTTWDASITGTWYWSASNTLAIVEHCGATVLLVPALTKRIRRFNSDYAALIYRGGFNQVNKYWNWWCETGYFDEQTQTSDIEFTEIYPEHTKFLATVLNGSHIIEAPLNLTTYSPAILTSFRESARESDDIFRPYHDENYRSTGYGFGESASRPDMFQINKHDMEIARNINSWFNPHWSFIYFFPPNLDESAPPQPYEWTLYGDRANPIDYWIPIRQQYAYNPELPTNDNRKTRLDLITAPLNFGFDRDYMAYLTSQETSFVGISRFMTYSHDMASSKTANQTDWTFTDCTPTHGAQLTLTPTSLSIVAKYDMGQYVNAPYLYPHLAEFIQLAWNTGNISSITVSLEGYDGSTVLIGTSQTTYFKPQGNTTKYAGSYAQDMSNGFDPQDTGIDLTGDGISTVTLADQERILAFQLLSGYNARYIVFNITCTAMSDVVINYPIFSRTTTTYNRFYETGVFGAQLFNNAGIRFGQNTYWDYITDTYSSTPIFNGLNSGPITILDAISLNNTLYKGVAANTDLSSYITTNFDSDEGDTTTDVAYHTFAVLMPNRKWVFYSSAREVPPLAVFPTFAKSAISYEDSTTYAQEVWSFAQEPKYYINPGDPLKLINQADDSQWNVPHSAYFQWRITKHAHQVDNEEGRNFYINRDNLNYAEVTPWHGYFFIPGIGGERNPEYTADPATNSMHKVFERSGNIFCKGSDFDAPIWTLEGQVTTTSDAEYPSITIDTQTSRIYVAYERADNNIYYKWSDDRGITWSAETTMSIAGKWPRVRTHRTTNEKLFACRRTSDGVLRYLYRDGGADAFDAEASAQYYNGSTLSDFVLEDEMFDIWHSENEQGAIYLAAKRSGDSAQRDYVSTDNGATWRLV